MCRCLLTSLFLFLFIINGPLAQSQDTWDLERCLERALQENISLKQSSLQVLSNETNLQQAKARRLPTLNASGGQNYSFGRSVDPFTNDFQNQTIGSGNVGLNSGITLFAGGQTYHTIARNKLVLESSKNNLKNVEYDILLQVAGGYVQVLQDQELLASAEVQLNSIKEQRDRTEKLVNAGSVPPGNLLELEAQVATEENNLVSAQTQLSLSTLVLRQLLNLSSQESFAVEKPNIPDPVAPSYTNVDEIFNYALENQPSIKSAHLDKLSAEKDIAIAKSGMYPRLSAGGSAGSGYTQFLSMDIPSETSVGDQITSNFNYGVGISLSVPIFNQRQVQTNIDQSKISLRNAEYGYDLAVQQLRQTIEQSYLDVQTSYNTFVQTNKQMESLQLAFDNSEKQYNAGVVNAVDYLLAKNNLARAQFSLVRAKYSYVMFSKVLDFYTGKTIGFN